MIVGLVTVLFLKEIPLKGGRTPKRIPLNLLKKKLKVAWLQ